MGGTAGTTALGQSCVRLRAGLRGFRTTELLSIGTGGPTQLTVLDLHFQRRFRDGGRSNVEFQTWTRRRTGGTRGHRD